jgi:hypothetical protein
VLRSTARPTPEGIGSPDQSAAQGFTKTEDGSIPFAAPKLLASTGLPAPLFCQRIGFRSQTKQTNRLTKLWDFSIQYSVQPAVKLTVPAAPALSWEFWAVSSPKTGAFKG